MPEEPKKSSEVDRGAKQEGDDEESEPKHRSFREASRRFELMIHSGRDPNELHLKRPRE